jgi:hypothetical protein
MKYLILFVAAISFTSCIKDRLKNEASLLVGTWTWSHSIEYNYDSANDTVVVSILSAEDYPNLYAVTFLEKGKVTTLRDGIDQEQYRVILDKFKSGSTQLSSGFDYKIKLDNRESDTLVGSVNSEELRMSDFHLPLSKGNDDYPYYEHIFLK